MLGKLHVWFLVLIKTASHQSIDRTFQRMSYFCVIYGDELGQCYVQYQILKPVLGHSIISEDLFTLCLYLLHSICLQNLPFFHHHLPASSVLSSFPNSHHLMPE